METSPRAEWATLCKLSFTTFLTTMNIDLFFDFVKGKLIVHKCTFQSKGQINKFHSLWKPLLCLALAKSLY